MNYTNYTNNAPPKVEVLPDPVAVMSVGTGKEADQGVRVAPPSLQVVMFGEEFGGSCSRETTNSTIGFSSAYMLSRINTAVVIGGKCHGID